MRMAEHSELHAFVGHANPSIVGAAESSGGGYVTGDVCDPRAVADFARAREVDLAMVSADEPLAAGVVDALLAQGTRTVGPTSAGAEIEWNKAFARELLADVAPEALPRLRIVRDRSEVADAVRSFGSIPVAVKPSGLTGGKGVKVMGPHLADHAAAQQYALELLGRGRPGESVLIEEKIVGAEFTIQAISDGTNGRLSARHLRLSIPLRRRRGARHGRHGLALDVCRHAAVHDHGALRAGLLDHRAHHRAPDRSGPSLQRRDEQRLLRDRGRCEGDRVQRPLRRSRVHEHHEPLQRQLARGDGQHHGRPARPERRAAARGRLVGALPGVPRLRPARRSARTSSRSTATPSRPAAPTCSSPRPSMSARTSTGRWGPPGPWPSRRRRRRSSRLVRTSWTAPPRCRCSSGAGTSATRAI